LISSFYDRRSGHSVLSNFYEGAPFSAPIFALRDTGFPSFPWKTVEHYYQAAKAAARYDALMIRDTATPGEAKKLGRAAKLRPDWEQVKLSVMREALALKFAEGTAEAAYLVSTAGHYLQEGNTWDDKFWGVCAGEGENWLGFCLMAQRSILMCTEEE
jgi:N-glycosidase YbiA